MVYVRTTNIETAITALEKGTCTIFDGSNAGWHDPELYRIIICINKGYGRNLIEISLNGNHFSQEAANLLCTAIGSTAQPALAEGRRRINQGKQHENPQ